MTLPEEMSDKYEITNIRCLKCAEGFTISLNGINCEPCPVGYKICFFRQIKSLEAFTLNPGFLLPKNFN